MRTTVLGRVKVAAALTATGATIVAGAYSSALAASPNSAHSATTSTHMKTMDTQSALTSYVNSHLGQKVGTGQCVSLVLHVMWEVYGLPTTGWGGNAYQWQPGLGNSAAQMQAHGFTWHTDGNYQNGDVLVWGIHSNMTQGHVGIYYNGQSFEENWNHVQAARLDSMAGRVAPAGYWRAPGGTPTPPPPPAPTNPCNPLPASWAWWQPSKAVQAAIQQQLHNDGLYNGPIDGVWGPNTKKAIQIEIKKAGYAGLVNGIPGIRTSCYVQKFAHDYGGYTGPINAKPGVNTWNGFLAALRNT